MSHPSRSFDMSVFFTRYLIGSMIIISLLVFADLLFFFWDITSSEPIRLLFIVPREDCLANWYSSLITLSVSLVALAVYYSKSKQSLWLLITVFFLYAAIDDATAIHERLGDELKMWVDDSAWDTLILAFPSYSWQLFIAPLFSIAAIFIALQLSRQLHRSEYRWLFAGFGLLATAILIDFVEGLLLTSLSGDTAGHLLRLVEETLEMIGMTLVFYSFGRYLNGLIELKIIDKPA